MTCYLPFLLFSMSSSVLSLGMNDIYQQHLGPPSLPPYTPNSSPYPPHLVLGGYAPTVAPSYGGGGGGGLQLGGGPKKAKAEGFAVAATNLAVVKPVFGGNGNAVAAAAVGPAAEFEFPACARNTTRHWCLSDYEYPARDIQLALEYHYSAVAALYKDVVANTANSVDRLKHLTEESSYLCPSATSYDMPLRAVNSEGRWRIVVNSVKAHYETLSQTARVEECKIKPGNKCPLLPECYESKCLQKFAYHRFLTYDPYDRYFPFAIESFKLPASCACFTGDSKVKL